MMMHFLFLMIIFLNFIIFIIRARRYIVVESAIIENNKYFIINVKNVI